MSTPPTSLAELLAANIRARECVSQLVVERLLRYHGAHPCLRAPKAAAAVDPRAAKSSARLRARRVVERFFEHLLADSARFGEATCWGVGMLTRALLHHIEKDAKATPTPVLEGPLARVHRLQAQAHSFMSALADDWLANQSPLPCAELLPEMLEIKGPGHDSLVRGTLVVLRCGVHGLGFLAVVQLEQHGLVVAHLAHREHWLAAPDDKIVDRVFGEPLVVCQWRELRFERCAVERVLGLVDLARTRVGPAIDLPHDPRRSVRAALRRLTGC